MKLIYPQGSLSNFLDKNPSIGGVNLGGNYAPHSPTSRGTYTTPAGRRALIQNVTLATCRTTAKTTSGFTSSYARIDPSGDNIYAYYQRLYYEAVGDNNVIAYNPNILIEPSITIEFFTADASVGGQVNFVINVQWVEFDAA